MSKIEIDHVSQHNMSSRPRLCHLKKWSGKQGYGFDLYSNSNNSSLNIIGNIDFDSPAEATGLKKNDYIVEINFKNIKNLNHNQIVDLIRNGIEVEENVYNKDEVIILVIDNEAKEYYDDLNIQVNSKMKNILKFTTPDKLSF
jgi:Na(+)/H(+) exchange regulatory cofactor NHE-RF1